MAKKTTVDWQQIDGSDMVWGIVQDLRNHRRTARVLDIASLLAWIGDDTVCAHHGGTVANCYGYPAVTDAVAMVVVDGHCLVWATEIPANKATASGAMRACLGGRVAGASDCVDGRCGTDRIDRAIDAVVAYARTELDRIGRNENEKI